MSDDTDSNPPHMRLALWIVLAAAVALAALYAIAPRQGKPPAATGAATPAAGKVVWLPPVPGGTKAALTFHSAPRPLPDVPLYDRAGKPRHFSEWRGKVLLVNFWASWCPPCRAEMPEIAALQEALAGEDFTVVAVSEDYKGYEWAASALKVLGGQNLLLLWDKGGAALRATGINGLPLTLLVDRQGREVARLVGPANWNAPEAHAVIRALLAQK